MTGQPGDKRAKTLAYAGLGLALAVFLADQATKWLILLSVMQPPRVIPVTPFFNLVLVWNQGISFGLFANAAEATRWVLTGLAVIVSAALLVWLWRASDRLTVYSLGGIVGGALGNALDRVIHGAVVDFLDLHAGGYHWPAFNLADSAITLGAVALIAQSFLSPAQSGEAGGGREPR